MSVGDDQILKLFHREYNTPETNPHLGKNHLAPVGKPVFCDELCDRETFLNFGVNNDCYRPEGLLHVVAVILRKSRTSMTALADSGGRTAQ